MEVGLTNRDMERRMFGDVTFPLAWPFLSSFG